jgi:phosphatidylserine decarboxylase
MAHLDDLKTQMREVCLRIAKQEKLSGKQEMASNTAFKVFLTVRKVRKADIRALLSYKNFYKYFGDILTLKLKEFDRLVQAERVPASLVDTVIYEGEPEYAFEITEVP